MRAASSLARDSQPSQNASGPARRSACTAGAASWPCSSPPTAARGAATKAGGLRLRLPLPPRLTLPADEHSGSVSARVVATSSSVVAGDGGAAFGAIVAGAGGLEGRQGELFGARAKMATEHTMIISIYTL